MRGHISKKAQTLSMDTTFYKSLIQRNQTPGLLSKKAQTLSMDLLLGLTVFLVIFIAVFGFLAFLTREGGTGQLEQESKLIMSAIESGTGPLGFIVASQIDGAKFVNLASDYSANYYRVQSSLGTKYNFCIYLEDENGNLLNVNGDLPDLGEDQVGIGNPNAATKLYINGVQCGVEGLPKV